MAAFPSPAPEQVAKRRFEEADMGLLVEGQWRDVWYDTGSTRGRFVRKDAAFRNWITADGSAGPSGVGGFKAEVGRYHLYVSLACPWAHRTLIMRSLFARAAKPGVSAMGARLGADLRHDLQRADPP
jgi:glutathionyl-hydroquinone reductase